MIAPNAKLDQPGPGPAGPPAVERVEAQGATFVVERLGAADAPLRLVWLHGWGQSRASLRPLAERFAARAENLLVDLPGFGDAPLPPSDWGTEQYGAMVADWLGRLGPARTGTVLVCHSFGGRVALRLAAAKPDQVQGLVLIAGAGLKRKRSAVQRARAVLLRSAVRGAAFVDGLARSGLARSGWAERMRNRVGSADYRRAGKMRGVFVRTVTEDLSETARRVRCPTLLVYGALDTETPPEFGQRFASLMPSAELAILPHFDHWTVLGAGRHQLESLMKRFLERPDLRA
jgi:pimeloyl-ACP methyl ester carboxylesterase